MIHFLAFRHSGALDGAEYAVDPTFRLAFPLACPGVPSELLDPSRAWADQEAFRATQAELAKLFCANFAKYADRTSAEVKAQGPADPAYPVAAE